MSQTAAVLALYKYELCVLCLANAQSRLRGERQGSCGRRHHYPIPSVCGEGRGVCQLTLDTAAARRVRLSYVLLAQETDVPDACPVSCTTTIV